MPTILIVDDHEIIIDGIKSLLQNEPDIQIIGEAFNGLQAINKVEELQPDIIIMDISMPDLSGIEATKIISEKYPNIKIIILTQHESKEYVMQVLKAGAHGYLLKNSKKNDLLQAISQVSENKKFLGGRISSMLLDDIIETSNNSDKTDIPEIPLTKREIEIIKLISNDKGNNQISDILNISLRTVETHRRNIMQKLNVNTVVALVRYAVKYKIITL